MELITHASFPLRLRARDSEETAAMQAALVALRAAQARRRIAGPARVSPHPTAAQDEVAVHIREVLHDLVDVEAGTAYLRLIHLATAGIAADDLCRDRIMGLTTLITGIAIDGGVDLGFQASAARLAAGGCIHSDLAAVRRLVDSVCDTVPTDFPARKLAPGLPLVESVGVLRELLSAETADAVTRLPGEGMFDLLDSVVQLRDPVVIDMFRSGSMIPKQEEEGRFLRQELARLLARQEHLSAREQRTARWTLMPLAEYGSKRPVRLESDRDFLDALAFLFRRFASRATALNATSSGEEADEFIAFIFAMGRHPALLRWWLPRSFIPEEGIRFGPEHRRVIETLVANPRRFLRQNGDPAAIAYRRLLRPLIPLFEGYHPAVEQSALLAALRAPESSLEHILDLMTSYLQTRVQTHSSEEITLFLGGGVSRLFADAAAVLEGTVLVSRFPHLRTAEDVALDRLIAEEEAAALVEIPIATPVEEPLPPELEWEVAPTPEDSPPVVFEMLDSPSGSRLRGDRLTTSRHALVDDLGEFLDRHGVQIEPPRSIARAIHHYLYEVPENIRHTWNKETLNGFSWHKLKRGRCRIYIRTVGETVCFAVINRRDWVHGDDPAARVHHGPRQD